MNLTDKEVVELRIKCLEPFVTVASKHGIEQDLVIQKAERAWEYAIEPLMQRKAETIVSVNKTTSAKKA